MVPITAAEPIRKTRSWAESAGLGCATAAAAAPDVFWRDAATSVRLTCRTMRSRPTPRAAWTASRSSVSVVRMTRSASSSS
eukprot:scaffold3515_cov94-Isochrysis_galbana.AAC.3